MWPVVAVCISSYQCPLLRRATHTSPRAKLAVPLGPQLTLHRGTKTLLISVFTHHPLSFMPKFLKKKNIVYCPLCLWERCKFSGSACRMNESVNKQAQSSQMRGHEESDLPKSEASEVVHFRSVCIIESSQNMNSHRVPPPRFPCKSTIPQWGHRRLTDVTVKLLGCCWPWQLAANFTGLAWRWDSHARKGPADVRQSARPGGQHTLVPCQAKPGQRGKGALQSRTTRH